MSSDSPADRDGPEGSAEARVVSGIANIERSFLRLTFWQTLLSLAGVFTGVVALYAALSESQAVREQTAASVWPYVQIIINDTDDGSTARFALSLVNVGVGPALVGGVEMRIGGKPVRSWDEVAGGLLDKPVRVGVDYGRNTVNRRVIGSGEEVVAFQTNDREFSLAMQDAVYSEDASLSICYCSIFDQCWVSSLTPEAGAAKSDPNESCPDYGDAAFLD